LNNHRYEAADTMTRNKHVGSNFDDFLAEEGIDRYTGDGCDSDILSH